MSTEVVLILDCRLEEWQEVRELGSGGDKESVEPGSLYLKQNL